MNFKLETEPERNFIGREEELKWLDEHLVRSRSSPTFINGIGGIGKTALIKRWLVTRRRDPRNTLWFDASRNVEGNALENVLIQLHERREDYLRGPRLAIVVDGTDHWNLRQHEEATAKILNYKAVSFLVFIRRAPLHEYPSRLQQLWVNPLSNSESRELLEHYLPSGYPESILDETIRVVGGQPSALSALAETINVHADTTTSSPLYDLSKHVLIPEKEIVDATRPIIVTVNQDLISLLKKQPSDIHRLTPREFEVVLADLLDDMGWEVKLTKQTRDGGADILAYLNTNIGRLLCLVEAKHYREDRKVGVDLVRTLYGTLCDAQANSAMLVTSSSFTSDAKVFQRKHEYQLKLHDYANVVEWILNFGKNKFS
ncbi:restriction endonuclease [Fibrella sp. WM1]|uniref:restriction endonuclease n=1 Tax=Fibrella musci TaxID=3242485 RepID=UPI00351FC395